MNSKADQPLRQHVRQALKQYFDSLEGEQACDVHPMVMSTVEKEVLLFTLKQGNYQQTEVAKTLGLNRGTLRNKMRAYNITVSPKSK